MRFHSPLTAFALLSIVAVAASAQGTPATAAAIRGTVLDSLKHGSLSGAAVDLIPGGRRVFTNDSGRFVFDNVAPGDAYQIRVAHPMLDTVGISLAIPTFAITAGETKVFTLAVPPAARLVSLFCSPAMLARGPSALVGFVRDPDTGASIDGATVSLVYEDGPIAVAKHPVNRVSQLDAAGRYKICGLPAQLDGKVQVILKTAQSAEIPVTIDPTTPLAMRGLGLSATTQRSTSTDSLGRIVHVLTGPGRFNGRVTTKAGLPIAGAHVQMASTRAAAISGPDGRFTLDSVPLGTQTINVRKIGYAVTDQAVDVEMGQSTIVSVVVDNYVPTLAPVVSVAQREKDLEKVGFSRRKAQGMGVYREAKDLPKTDNLGDALASMPGLKIGHINTGSGTRNVIQGANGLNNCLNFVVDGIAWREVGDAMDTIEDFIHPEDVEAVELYSASTAPLEFAQTVQSSCQVLVIWTNRKIHGGGATAPGKPPR